MEQPLSPARLLRGLLICTAGVLPAVGAHVAGGGNGPSPLLMIAVLLGSSAAAATVSRREWTTPALVLALSALQVLVHGLLWVGGLHSAHAAGSTGSITVLHGGGAMVAWHSIAIALSVVALRHGERLIHLFARLVRSALGSTSRALLPIPATSGITRVGVRTHLRPSTLLLDSVHRRGPPVALPAT
jgi:hypothetical protein